MNIQWKIALNAANNSPRCGAKTRRDTHLCKSPAMKNGRCRMHGGKSPGAPLGIKHGRYVNGLHTKEVRQNRQYVGNLIKTVRTLCR